RSKRDWSSDVCSSDLVGRNLMQRRSFLAGTAAAAGLATAGCGNLATSDPDTLTFMFRGGLDERAAYTEAIAEFERQNDVTVNVVVTDGDQYDTKLQAAI